MTTGFCPCMVNARNELNMRLGQTKLSPLFRSLAAVTALAWVAALVLCTIYCSFGGGHCDDKQASCHASTAAKEHHDGDSSEPTHHDSSTTASCLTLNTVLLNGGSPALVQPHLPVLYTLAPFALALDATATEPTASFSRQAKLRDWVFTPEVCLGPAFRSLAPPLA
ncbi:MAG: hypothetical protein ABI651_09485 [Verrucomicrobiota bacterium]